jgi:tetraacyldisaccharide 4'-kinase
VPLADLADAIWYGDTSAARVARAALSPLSSVFGAVVSRLHAAYDADPPEPGRIPAISIGNLTVGGTGKTPVSAWFARRFVEAGASPAIVMRGYGEDEILVHRLLNPDVPVYGQSDRRAGVLGAALRGADLAILDDAFQHRRAARVADVVLVSADRWTGDVRLLPAGPFREPLSALRRATVVLLTVKAANRERIAAAERAIRGVTDSTVVTVDLAPASFVAVGSQEATPVAEWRGRRVLAVSGIGDPAAFLSQLTRLGLDAMPLSFADHHRFDDASVRRVVVASAGFDGVVCTLKDAVKLGPKWPGSAVPLWYLSQTVVPRDSTDVLDAAIHSVLAARGNARISSDLQR